MRSLELFAAARSADADSALVIAEPQVYRRIVRPLARGADGELDCEVWSDLAWNRARPANAAATPQDVVRAGVRDTLLERIVVLGDLAAKPADGTAALFAAAASAGIEPIAVRAADDPRLSTFPAAARARLAADLAEGYVAVVPQQPLMLDGEPRLGWWRVDERTGHTVGAMDTGLLQETVEYSQTQTVNGIRITRFYRRQVGPEARRWAEAAIRRRDSTTLNQFNNLMVYAQRTLETLGRLPTL
jgi:hypothetical protein